MQGPRVVFFNSQSLQRMSKWMPHQGPVAEDHASTRLPSKGNTAGLTQSGAGVKKTSVEVRAALGQSRSQIYLDLLLPAMERVFCAHLAAFSLIFWNSNRRLTIYGLWWWWWWCGGGDATTPRPGGCRWWWWWWWWWWCMTRLLGPHIPECLPAYIFYHELPFPYCLPLIGELCCLLFAVGPSVVYPSPTLYVLRTMTKSMCK